MSETSEAEHFAKLLHHLQEAAMAMCGLAQLRKSPQLHGVYIGLLAMKEQLIKLVTNRPMAHTDAMAILSQREQVAASAAAKQRYEERVRAAKQDLVTLQ